MNKQYTLLDLSCSYRKIYISVCYLNLNNQLQTSDDRMLLSNKNKGVSCIMHTLLLVFKQLSTLTPMHKKKTFLLHKFCQSQKTTRPKELESDDEILQTREKYIKSQVFNFFLFSKNIILFATITLRILFRHPTGQRVR